VVENAVTPDPLRLVFLGSDAIALPLLDWLTGEGAEQARVTAVFTRPDRPAGRGQKLQANAIKAWALERGLPVFQPEKLTDNDMARLIELETDVTLVAAYGQILGDSFIAAPRLGTLNLHASLLPKYRGASPIQTAIASGESETGMALMRIVRELDAGPVADVERVPIAPLDTAADIEAKLALAGIALAARAFPLLARGELEFFEQDAAEATYCRRLTRADGGLDFTDQAAVLAARINGLFPWPGCAVDIAGQPIKVGLADTPGGQTSAPPGTVIGADADGLLVAALDGVLRLRRLQRPGGRMLPAAEFLCGFPVAVGTYLPSQPMPVLVTAG
jgi:methionyl-tRNA formyltransferase